MVADIIKATPTYHSIADLKELRGITRQGQGEAGACAVTLPTRPLLLLLLVLLLWWCFPMVLLLLLSLVILLVLLTMLHLITPLLHLITL
jgi:hypothetical protein